MTRRQIVLLLSLALIWGSSFLFIKWGVLEMSPLMVVMGRLVFGLLFLFGALVVRGRSLPPLSLWKPLLVVGIVNNAVPWFLIAWGEQYVSSGLASVLNATTPFFSVVLAVTWGDEHFSWLKVLGLLLGFVGVNVLIGADLREFFTTASSRVALGELAILASAILYAVGAVYARRELRGVPPLQVATGQLGAALLLTLPVLLVAGDLPATMPSLRALLAVGALGLFGSGLAYVLFYELLEQVGATRTVIVTYLLPVVALFLGWLLLDEPLTVSTLVGMAIILSGVGLVNGIGFRPRRRLPVQEAAP